MRIKLEYVATLRVQGPASGSVMELPEGATVAALLDRLGITASHQQAVSAFVGNRRVSHASTLSDGDEVFLSIPMSGG